MGGTIPAKLMPAEGSTLDFEGTPVSYTPDPVRYDDGKGRAADQGGTGKKPPSPSSSRREVGFNLKLIEGSVSSAALVISRLCLGLALTLTRTGRVLSAPLFSRSPRDGRCGADA